jgi:hypothetical protein
MAQKITKTIALNAITLTGSYTGTQISSAIAIKNSSQVMLDVAYTMGAAETSNSIQIKVEFANPAEVVNTGDVASTDWHRQISESTTSGTTTISLQEYTFSAVSAAATYDRFQIAIPVCSRFIRVSAKETGIAANGGTATISIIQREEIDC